MKSFPFLSIAAVLTLAIPATAAAQMQQPGYSPMHHQRFEKMDSKIDEAQKLHGKERRRIMLEHLQMMRDQMQSMHGMMGGTFGHGPGNTMMGQSRMTPEGMAPAQMGPMGADGAQMLQNMQGRMDMMQKTIEQMLKQHELMLKDDR
jgi:hypothetical protein